MLYLFCWMTAFNARSQSIALQGGDWLQLQFNKGDNLIMTCNKRLSPWVIVRLLPNMRRVHKFTVSPLSVGAQSFAPLTSVEFGE